MGVSDVRSWSTIWKRLQDDVQDLKTQPMLGRTLIYSFYALLFVAVAIYLITSFLGGGDAWHGRKAAGRFFVARYHGGAEHEVAARLFYLNLWDANLVFALLVIGMIAGLCRALSKRFRTRSR